MPARLIHTGLADPARVSAIDEAVLDAVAEGRSGSVLHLYRRDRPTVSLGRFVETDDAIDRSFLEEAGIAVVRRLSAGGAIYTDPDQIIYALASPDLGTAPAELLEDAGERLAEELSTRFGAEAAFVPDNDVHVDGRKVAGMAVALRRGVAMLHGTLVLETDVDRMARALGADPEAVRGRVSGLREVLDRDVTLEDAEAAVVAALGGMLGEELVPRQLGEAEEARVRHLVESRYANDAWTYRR